MLRHVCVCVIINMLGFKCHPSCDVHHLIFFSPLPFGNRPSVLLVILAISAVVFIPNELLNYWCCSSCSCHLVDIDAVMDVDVVGS